MLVALILFLTWCEFAWGNTGVETEKNNLIKIGKCCELDEILVDDICTPAHEMKIESGWKPDILDDESEKKKKIPSTSYEFKIGLPNCRQNEQQWQIYHGQDRLEILSSGKLRHSIHDHDDLFKNDKQSSSSNYFLDDAKDITVEPMHYDYSFGQYCADKVITSNGSVTIYAMVCVPGSLSWTDADKIIKTVVDPMTRALCIICYLLVAIVYFVLPQLRDLVGNIITSMNLCLVTNQIAVIVRIFTINASHVSFLIADTIAYVSLLAAFFWLNALGYFVWNTFRSRNVFLRVTDGRKYCYYSSYAWGSTATIAATAIFAHYGLETSKSYIDVGPDGTIKQETIGFLAMSFLFTSIAFTIIVDLCFVLTTANTIKRMRTYGRIHHKMKYSFRMFTFIFIFMSIGWLSFLISKLKYDQLVYCHIVINLLQAILILYVCVFGQKRVTFLLSKTCNCCDSGNNNSNNDGLDWGEEMTAINAGY